MQSPETNKGSDEQSVAHFGLLQSAIIRPMRKQLLSTEI